ncbi:helix-turn-helix domain-containing protein [Alicyclobacillus fodiniaquatilis]|uniref:Helix-turn-helix domain-containing protein n=1 Tax=Alicyclobacillus fodiniaquatilis TaxID=1661150 RepID=A0ABW4JE07_9BACL
MDELKTISQVASETGTTAAQLRYWDEKGLIKSKKNSTGTRFFSVDQYSRIEFIKKILSQPKATIEDARRAIYGEQALQAKEAESKVETTEIMLSKALDSALTGEFGSLMEMMTQTFTQMRDEFNANKTMLEAIQRENAELRERIASYELRTNDKLSEMKSSVLKEMELNQKELLSTSRDTNASLTEKITSYELQMHDKITSYEAKITQLELAATEDRRKVEERDRELMETLRTMQERAQEEARQQKRGWWPWRRA